MREQVLRADHSWRVAKTKMIRAVSTCARFRAGNLAQSKRSGKQSHRIS